jgi:hypothetical protein
MPELNFISTDASGDQGLQQTPYLRTTVPGYSYGTPSDPSGNASGDGFMEYGSGTAGSLPFHVDQAGNVTAASLTATTGLNLLAATPEAGYTLVNSTGNIITWTAPNDGNLHRFQIFSALHVTSNETGGTIAVSYTLPDGTTTLPTLFTASQSAGAISPATTFLRLMAPGSTVTIEQTSALSAGAAVMWAEIWGS